MRALSEPDYDRQHAEPELDRSSQYTVMFGPNLECGADFSSYPEARQFYRHRRAFSMTRECQPGYQLELMPPDGVKLTALQYADLFDDSVPAAYLETNPAGKHPTTCGHARHRRVNDKGRTVCLCLVCSHRWAEYPIGMEASW